MWYKEITGELGKPATNVELESNPAGTNRLRQNCVANLSWKVLEAGNLPEILGYVPKAYYGRYGL